MPSLHDLAIDLINDAKALKNIAAKLYNLEQVKEIAFHRDTSILSELAPDVISSFMVERSAAIRKFLITFAADWLMVDFSAAIPLSLSMFGFLLASESGDGPLRQISTELTKIYDRIVMHITGLPIKARASGPNVADPKSYWGSLRTIVSRLIDMISSDRSEQLRAQSLKLAENMILFGLPAEKLSSDPRLAKSRPQSGDSSKGLSAGDIPLHHPFINRNDLEQEAESIFSKMLLWASKGGPQGHPFSPAQMALLGGNIANIASLRPKKSTNAATALVQVLQGKGSMCHLMAKEERDNLARCIQKLLRATYALPDPDGLMSKLRSALDSLVAMVPAPQDSAVESTLGVKRHADERDEDLEGLESGGPGSLDVRASAIAAVDAAENSIKIKAPRIEPVLAPGIPLVQVPGPTAGATVPQTAVCDTELSAELCSFPDISTNIKLVTLQAASAATDTASALAPTASGLVSSSGLIIRPTPAASDSYSDLALLSVKRILDSFRDIQNFGTKTSSAHVKFSVRMVMTMTLLDMAEAKGTVRVPLFSSLSPSSSASLMKNVPQELNIPRCLWVVLSHILNGNLSRPPTQQVHHTKGLSAESVDLITAILKEILNRTSHGKKSYAARGRERERGRDKKPCLLEDLYNDSCVAVLARLLQGIETRSVAKDVLMGLPCVPLPCLDLLHLLVHTGTRAVTPAQGVRRDAVGPRNRGTRTEAITLLGQLVFSSDETAGYSSLYHLLWCAVTDDFEVRSKAVALLVGEVVPGEESVFETVALFSVHSMIAVVGADQVAKRTAAISQLQLEVGVGAGRVVEGVEGEGEGDGMQVTDLSNEGSGEGEREGGGMDVVDSTVSPPEDTTEGGKSTEILDSTSGPEGNAEHPECEEERHLTLKIAVESFDDGKVFKGVFQNCKNPASFTPVVREKTEQSVKKSIQLLTQLSVSEPFLLNALFNLYGAALSVTQSVTTERKIKEMGGDKDGGTEGGADGSAGDGDGSVAVPSTSTTEATAVKKVSRVESKYTVICDIIEAELSSIIPIISKRQDSLSLFSALTRTDSDPCIRPLLEITLEIIHTDYTLPASPALIEAVKAYTESRPFALSMQNHDLKLQLEKEKEEKIEKNEDISEIIKEIEMANAAFEEEKVTASLRLFFPLLGGFSAVEILDLIPRLLKTFSDEPEVLKNVFKRIYSARPPALSKATLFAALHRVDCDTSGLKQKVVLDVISLCLGNKEEFRSDVIKEALGDLLLDGVPAQALMRTAILSAQSYGNEMKKFILSDVVPSLIRKKVWNLAPKVWEGVNHAVKIFAEHKNAEPTLRCLLGLPGIQLKSILKAAPKVKPLLGSLLKALSAEEKEESLTGKWAGIAVENVESTGVPVVDAEKAKIIKELSAIA